MHKYSVRMPVRISDLVAAPELHLLARHGSRAGLDREVRWCAVTELADPRPWLQGGELVLTTGLRQRTAGLQQEFVSRVAERDVAGIGFAIGLTHDSVPKATLAAAAEHQVVVLEVPYEVPFIAVDRFVADRILHAHYQRQHDLLRRHDTLSRALLSGGGLAALIRSLQQLLDAPVGVVDAFGRTLVSAPAGAVWTLADTDPLHSAPIEIGGALVAWLCTRTPRDGIDLLPYAANLVGLELARRQAQLAGRRELLGQVIEDIAATTISATEAHRRLGAHGVDVRRPYAVVLAAAPPGATERLRTLPGGIYPLTDSGVEPVVTAHVGEHLAVLVGQDRDPHEVATVTHRYVAQLGDGVRVGIGAAYEGVNGLRWSYHEAREALTRGAGVNGREPLSLPGLLLSSESLPLVDLGREVLAPLRRCDETTGSALVETLRVYLEEDASVARTAARLFVHRNTVRYRLEQIERLTGRSLESTPDRVQLWLALQVVALSGRTADVG